ncbi:hypothetical protein EHS25_005718 [Saitozyma podzolica]|uniref:Uncharacterized protein n=1 Tax=Saitozyma podzolica TaxID=1890683 RepID=A0A427XVT5_9TREE|nr:hypothetical protein EHS25_005718 [Saitozyma podzolica]
MPHRQRRQKQTPAPIPTLEALPSSTQLTTQGHGRREILAGNKEALAGSLPHEQAKAVIEASPKLG